MSSLIQRQRRRPGSRIVSSLLLVGTFVVIVAPVFYLIPLSLKPTTQVFDGRWWPSEIVATNWTEAFTSLPGGLLNYIGNSWIVSGGAAFLTLAIAVPTAYYTARGAASGHRMLTLLLAAYCAPPIVALIPFFLMLRGTGLLNTLFGLVLVTGLTNVPVAVWMIDGFMRKIPGDLEEAAWMDGAGRFRTLWRIIVPLVLPGLTAAFLVCLFLGYSEFLFALSFTQTPDAQTLAVGLSIFESSGNEISFGKNAAAALAGILPMYLLAALAQKQLVAGLSAGSIK
jgi:multiple sugar transport system permease protein